MTILAFAFAALIGLSLGLLGGGGSILTTPVLVYVMGFAPKPAIAMSLVVVGVASFIGSVGHWRAGNVHLRMALLFGGIAMVGAYAGARLAVFLSGTVQLIILAIVMLAAAVSMVVPRKGGENEKDVHEGAELSFGKILLVGLGVGGLTGIVGIGGGFLIVPALVIVGRVPMKQAVGTSLVVIAMNSAAGFAGYLNVVDIPWGTLSVFTAVAALGILAATYLIRFITPATLKRSFAALLVVVGVFMLYQH